MLIYLDNIQQTYKNSLWEWRRLLLIVGSSLKNNLHYYCYTDWLNYIHYPCFLKWKWGTELLKSFRELKVNMMYTIDNASSHPTSVMVTVGTMWMQRCAKSVLRWSSEYWADSLGIYKIFLNKWCHDLIWYLERISKTNILPLQTHILTSNCIMYHLIRKQEQIHIKNKGFIWDAVHIILTQLKLQEVRCKSFY